MPTLYSSITCTRIPGEKVYTVQFNPRRQEQCVSFLYMTGNYNPGETLQISLNQKRGKSKSQRDGLYKQWKYQDTQGKKSTSYFDSPQVKHNNNYAHIWQQQPIVSSSQVTLSISSLLIISSSETIGSYILNFAPAIKINVAKRRNEKTSKTTTKVQEDLKNSCIYQRWYSNVDHRLTVIDSRLTTEAKYCKSQMANLLRYFQIYSNLRIIIENSPLNKKKKKLRFYFPMD